MEFFNWNAENKQNPTDTTFQHVSGLKQPLFIQHPPTPSSLPESTKQCEQKYDDNNSDNSDYILSDQSDSPVNDFVESQPTEPTESTEPTEPTELSISTANLHRSDHTVTGHTVTGHTVTDQSKPPKIDSGNETPASEKNTRTIFINHMVKKTASTGDLRMYHKTDLRNSINTINHHQLLLEQRIQNIEKELNIKTKYKSNQKIAKSAKSTKCTTNESNNYNFLISIPMSIKIIASALLLAHIGKYWS